MITASLSLALRQHEERLSFQRRLLGPRSCFASTSSRCRGTDGGSARSPVCPSDANEACSGLHLPLNISMRARTLQLKVPQLHGETTLEQENVNKLLEVLQRNVRSTCYHHGYHTRQQCSVSEQPPSLASMLQRKVPGGCSPPSGAGSGGNRRSRPEEQNNTLLPAPPPADRRLITPACIIDPAID